MQSQIFSLSSDLLHYEIFLSHCGANSDDILGIMPSKCLKFLCGNPDSMRDDSINLFGGAETALEKTLITVDCSSGISV